MEHEDVPVMAPDYQFGGNHAGFFFQSGFPPGSYNVCCSVKTDPQTSPAWTPKTHKIVVVRVIVKSHLKIFIRN